MLEESKLIRTLEVRKSAKIALRILRVIAAGYLLSAFFWLLFFIFSPKMILVGKQIVNFLISSLGWAMLLFQYLFSIKPTMSISIDLFSDRLIFRKNKSETILQYSDIESFRFSSFKYFLYGRLILTLKNGETYKLSSTFERLDLILELIYKFNSTLCSKEHFDKTLDQIIFIDHGIARTHYIYDQKVYLKYCLMIFLFLPFLFGCFIYFKQAPYLNVVGFDNYFAPLLTYLFILPFAFFNVVLLFLNQYFYIRTRNQFLKTKNKARDLFAEFLIFKKVFISFAFIMACFFISLAATDKNTIISYSITKNLPELSYKIGDHILIDQKYSRFSGRYQLQQGDLIMLSVGNKKTIAHINLDATLLNRKLASAETESFTLQAQTLDGQKLSAKSNDIIGKVVSLGF